MKIKYVISIALILIMALVLALPGCNPTPVAPGASAEFSNLHIRGTLFVNPSGDGTTYYRLTLPSATTTLTYNDGTQTLTNKTLTSPTITAPTITGAGTALFTSIGATSAGTANISTLTATSGTVTTGTVTTLTSTTANLATANITSLKANLTGVLYGNGTTAATAATAAQIKTASQIASGNVTFTSGYAATTVTHGLGTYPTWILVSWMSSPGGAYALYTGTATTTTFVATSTSNVTGTPVMGWIAGY